MVILSFVPAYFVLVFVFSPRHELETKNSLSRLVSKKIPDVTQLCLKLLFLRQDKIHASSCQIDISSGLCFENLIKDRDMSSRARRFFPCRDKVMCRLRLVSSKDNKVMFCLEFFETKQDFVVSNVHNCIISFIVP